MERDQLTMLLAANIQATMAERGTNAAQVARDSGLNRTGVYDIISGKSKSPRLETIAKIATALNVSVASLLRDHSDADLRDQIVMLFESLPETERQRLLATARAWTMLPD